MFKRFGNAFSAALVIAAIVGTVPAYAAQLVAWDNGNHVYVAIGAATNNNLINPSSGNLVPDTYNVTCLPGTSNPTSFVCAPGPNDGHTYNVSAVNFRQTGNGNGSTCTIGVEVAGAATPFAATNGGVGNGSSVGTPIPCQTAVPSNTNTQMVMAPTPTLNAGNGQVTNASSINVLLTAPTAVANGEVNVTLVRQS